MVAPSDPFRCGTMPLCCIAFGCGSQRRSDAWCCCSSVPIVSLVPDRTPPLDESDRPLGVRSQTDPDECFVAKGVVSQPADLVIAFVAKESRDESPR